MSSWMDDTIEYSDNSPIVLGALDNAILRGLMACGEVAVGYAQDDCPVDTGRLRNSITYKVNGQECYIGTNVKYAPYIEFGTGEFAEKGGRKTPWTYVDDKGNWHMTSGQRAQPFLRPAASQHSDEYRDILKSSLENA